jgi:hypothetical protein
MIGHCAQLEGGEDGPEILDEEQDTEDHEEELTGMHTREISSLEQPRIGRAGGLVRVSGRLTAPEVRAPGRGTRRSQPTPCRLPK